MVERAVIGGERIFETKDAQRKPTTAELRLRAIPALISRIEHLINGKRDYALNEVDFFIRSQPQEERTLAFVQLMKAVEKNCPIIELLEEYELGYRRRRW